MTWLAVRAFLGRIPRGVWIALAVLALAGLLYWAHQREVKQTIAAAEKRGEDRAYKIIAAKAREIERKANDISRKLKEQNREEVARINRDADDLRLRGPGKARANCPGIPPSPGRSQPASERSNAAGPEMPSDDRAAVPWAWLVDRAEQCDLNRAEALTWREWYRQQVEAWPKAP